MDDDKGKPRSNQSVTKRHLDRVEETLVRSLCLPLDFESDVQGRPVTFQVSAVFTER